MYSRNIVCKIFYNYVTDENHKIYLLTVDNILNVDLICVNTQLSVRRFFQAYPLQHGNI